MERSARFPSGQLHARGTHLGGVMTQVFAAIDSAFHLLALAIGLPAIVIRGITLAGPLDAAAVRRTLRADTLWGIAAGSWLATGAVRAFGPLEKGSAFYLHSTLFYIKMG